MSLEWRFWSFSARLSLKWWQNEWNDVGMRFSFNNRSLGNGCRMMHFLVLASFRGRTKKDEGGRNEKSGMVFYGGNHPTFFPPLSSFWPHSEVILKLPVFSEWLRRTLERGRWSERQEWKREWLWIQGRLTFLPHRLALLSQRLMVVLTTFLSFPRRRTMLRSYSFQQETIQQWQYLSFQAHSISKSNKSCSLIYTLLNCNPRRMT